MTNIPPDDPIRDSDETPDLNGDDVEAARKARRRGADQVSLANNNPADRSPKRSTGGDGAAALEGRATSAPACQAMVLKVTE
ncbi:hypothetical protein RSD66_04350 [Brevundimonas sp. S1H14]|uniref:hypothetical protein n=1 Tax=Brevundimonas sp. S1H14 TaxID=3078084 RepID=UPI0039ECB535